MKFTSFFLLMLLVCSCEKAVDFQLDQVQPKLVVEATIENDGVPVVVLTKSLNYFARITPDLLAGAFVHGAEVSVSNGSSSLILKEYSVSLTPVYSYYYYTADSATLANSFRGAIGGRYTLQIRTDGETYTASTTIPGFNKRIDSLWWKGRPGDSSEVSIVVKSTDPPGFGNYIRYWTKRNREAFLPGFASVYDDLVVDGTTYELEVEPGVDRNGELRMEERVFRRGDTVTLKLSGIDKGTYDFWRTMEYTYGSVGNPFASPIKVTSNISNGALGYFGGYASQFKTIVIPR